MGLSTLDAIESNPYARILHFAVLIKQERGQRTAFRWKKKPDKHFSIDMGWQAAKHRRSIQSTESEKKQSTGYPFVSRTSADCVMERAISKPCWVNSRKHLQGFPRPMQRLYDAYTVNNKILDPSPAFLSLPSPCRHPSLVRSNRHWCRWRKQKVLLYHRLQNWVHCR